MHIYLCTYVSICAYQYMLICLYAHAYTCLYAYMLIYTYVHMCICTYAYICICLYVHTPTWAIRHNLYTVYGGPAPDLDSAKGPPIRLQHYAFFWAICHQKSLLIANAITGSHQAIKQCTEHPGGIKQHRDVHGTSGTLAAQCRVQIQCGVQIPQTLSSRGEMISR